MAIDLAITGYCSSFLERSLWNLVKVLFCAVFVYEKTMPAILFQSC